MIKGKPTETQKIDIEQKRITEMQVLLQSAKTKLARSHVRDAKAETKDGNADKEETTLEDDLNAIFQPPIIVNPDARKIRSEVVKACYDDYLSENLGTGNLAKQNISYFKNLYLTVLQKQFDVDHPIVEFNLTHFQKEFPVDEADKDTKILIHNVITCYFSHFEKQHFDDFVDEMASAEAKGNSEEAKMDVIRKADAILACMQEPEKSISLRTKARLAKFHYTHDDPYKGLELLKEIGKEITAKQQQKNLIADELEQYITGLLWMSEQGFLPAKAELRQAYFTFDIQGPLLTRVNDLIVVQEAHQLPPKTSNKTSDPKTAESQQQRREKQLFLTAFWANGVTVNPEFKVEKLRKQSAAKIGTSKKSSAIKDELTPKQLLDKATKLGSFATRFAELEMSLEQKDFSYRTGDGLMTLHEDAKAKKDRALQNVCIARLKKFTRNWSWEVTSSGKFSATIRAHEERLANELAFRRALYCLKQNKLQQAKNFCRQAWGKEPRVLEAGLLMGTLEFYTSFSTVDDKRPWPFDHYIKDYTQQTPITDAEIITLADMCKNGFVQNPYVPEKHSLRKITLNMEQRSAIVNALFKLATDKNPNSIAAEQFEALNRANKVRVAVGLASSTLVGDSLKFEFNDKPLESKKDAITILGWEEIMSTTTSFLKSDHNWAVTKSGFLTENIEFYTPDKIKYAKHFRQALSQHGIKHHFTFPELAKLNELIAVFNVVDESQKPPQLRLLRPDEYPPEWRHRY